MLKYFGTDGVRGVANETLTAKTAYRIGRYLGQNKSENCKSKILVCQDTRLSSDLLRTALISGLLSSGAIVYDEGISSTPSVSYLVRQEKFDYGVMISASHNPFADNGIKVFNSVGEKLEDEIEEKIEAYMDAKEDYLPLPSGKDLGHLYDGSPLKEEYLGWLISKAQGDFSSVKVLFDCANGSTSYLAPKLFSLLKVQAHFINASSNGVNINEKCGSTHLEGLKKAFLEGDYDLGFAFDGDGDRFMAFARDGKLIDGDLQIFLHALCLKKKNLLSENKVVITVMSNLGLRKALDKAGIGYEIVPVGDKNVQAKMKEESLKVGGEQSGHVIFLDELNTGDGLLSAIEMLNLFVNEPAIYNEHKTFKVYPQVLKNVSFSSHDDLKKAFNDAHVTKVIEEVTKELDGEGRVLVRESGTEALLRVMIEARSDKECSLYAEKIVSAIKEVQ
jgi:phosphoglucosamine mutase